MAFKNLPAPDKSQIDHCIATIPLQQHFQNQPGQGGIPFPYQINRVGPTPVGRQDFVDLFNDFGGELGYIEAEKRLAQAYAGYGRLHEQKGQIEKARDYLSKALDIFERLGTLIEPEKVREILADLPKA